MDGICRFVDVAEIRGGPPIWTERERERHCVKEREREGEYRVALVDDGGMRAN